MTEPAKIEPERVALSLEPALHPVKGGLGGLRGWVQPNLHGSDVVLRS